MTSRFIDRASLHRVQSGPDVESMSLDRVEGRKKFTIGTLYDEGPEGDRRRISQFAINPELRSGVSTPSPVLPGQRYEMEPPGFAMAHDLRAGHRLVLRFTTSDPDKVPTFAADPNVTVFTGPNGTRLQVPVVTKPALVPDTVPLSLEEDGAVEGQPASTLQIPNSLFFQRAVRRIRRNSGAVNLKPR